MGRTYFYKTSVTYAEDRPASDLVFKNIHLDVCRCGYVWGWHWLLVVNRARILRVDIKINFYKLISIPTTYYTTTIKT